MNTKKILILFLCLIVANIGKSQNVKVEINSGIYNASLKQTIEKNASALLSEINRANRSGAVNVNFTGISITSDAQTSIAMLWEATPFYCEDRTIVEPLISTYSGGYQIRNIPLEFTPSKLVAEDETHQEVVIDFDKSGKIEGFNLTIDNNQYKNIVAEGVRLGDFDRRQMILRHIEDFRTAYNKKDTAYLEKVYSDDALIITGRVMKTKKSDYNIIPQNKVKMVTQNKREYLKNLKNVFKKHKYINVKFDKIEILRHPTLKDYYGVSLRQDYSSVLYNDKEDYKDKGYLFLLWDFSKGDDNPQIHVRVWEDKKNFIGPKQFSLYDLTL